MFVRRDLVQNQWNPRLVPERTMLGQICVQLLKKKEVISDADRVYSDDEHRFALRNALIASERRLLYHHSKSKMIDWNPSLIR